MDITTFTMILVIRFISLSFCYKDGAEDDKDLLPEQIERKVQKMPNVLEMFSYTYFCCTCFCGPFYDFADYIKFIEMKGHYHKIPNSIGPTLYNFAKAKMCLVVVMALGPTFYYEHCVTDQFLAYSFPYKVFYYYMAMTLRRFLYYVPWALTDAALCASGLSYEGMDPKTGKAGGFERIYTVQMLGVEAGLTPAAMMVSWNH
mmetsp:Transcript_38321/g.36675  ORF Transcript_38321/g.36675 Transcript_38321/m.36675 type:complete len:202 (+) Transcript_38321:359-964(+)